MEGVPCFTVTEGAATGDWGLAFLPQPVEKRSSNAGIIKQTRLMIPAPVIVESAREFFMILHCYFSMKKTEGLIRV